MAAALNTPWPALATALVAGSGAAWAIWLGPTALRLVVAASLVGASCACPAWHGSAPMIVALPTLAALRRAPAGMVAEAIMAGCGWPRLTLLVLKIAAPGFAFGALLCLVPHAAWAFPAAALPLLVQGRFSPRRDAPRAAAQTAP